MLTAADDAGTALTLACPTATFCAALDGLDEALTYTTPGSSPQSSSLGS